MNGYEMLRDVLLVLGGGVVATLVGGVIAWIRQHRATKRDREVDHLLSQLAQLYGPLYFLTNLNSEFFRLNREIHEAYGPLFVDPNWHESAHESVMVEAKATIQLANDYVARVVENNQEAIRILKQNWHLVDVEDIEEFTQFQIDSVRYEQELAPKSSEGSLQRIYEALGDISFMRPTVVDLVKNRVREKQARLEKLRG